MRLPSLWSNRDLADPFRSMRRELDDFFSDFSQRWPSLETTGLKSPAINVAETDGQIEITAELPGVDQNDIKLSVEGNRVVISGEKKQETTSEEKDWHVVERNYGSFRRAVALPFEPSADAVEAHYDKGVLHLSIRKPAQAQPQSKTIEIKAGAPAASAPTAPAAEAGGANKAA